MKRENFFLTDKQSKQLAAEAKRTDTKKAEIVRRALDLYFASAKKGKE
jgi:hypothetical protein